MMLLLLVSVDAGLRQESDNEKSGGVCLCVVLVDVMCDGWVRLVRHDESRKLLLVVEIVQYRAYYVHRRVVLFWSVRPSVRPSVDRSSSYNTIK
eukprot:scaffold1182_cov165-Amphora_coffeaeformis.AAC.6